MKGRPFGNKNHFKHGMARTRIYFIWKTMRQRCFNPNAQKFKNYGARGITICEEWSDFKNFYQWAIQAGYTDELTIERANVNGNYEPENCLWIRPEEQANNKTSTHWIVDNGKKISMAAYCRNHNLKYKYFSSLLSKGFSLEQATVKAK